MSAGHRQQTYILYHFLLSANGRSTEISRSCISSGRVSGTIHPAEEDPGSPHEIQRYYASYCSRFRTAWRRMKGRDTSIASG